VSAHRAIVNTLLVYLLLFTGGTWRFRLSDDKYLIIGFLIALLAWVLYSDRKFSDKFLLYVVVFTGFLVSLSLYTGGSLSLVSAIAGTMKIMLAYLIIKTVGNSFVDTYLKVVAFLAVFSWFGYLTDTFGLFNGIVLNLPAVGDKGYEGIFYLYRFDWHMKRNNSIFFEPGAYQAFLNIGLFMLFFDKTSFSRTKKWIYIAILAITLVTTFSTTGFLIFACLLVLVLIKSDLLTVSGKIKMVGLAVVVISLLSAQFYSTVIVKLGHYFAASEDVKGNPSGKARSSDARTDLKLFKDHVFGMGNKEYNRAFLVVGGFSRDMAGEVSSSNGVTKTLAEMGLPYSLFLFGSYYWAFRRLLYDSVLAGGAFIMFMMFLASESYYMSSPISFAIIASAFIYNRMLIKEAQSPVST